MKMAIKKRWGSRRGLIIEYFQDNIFFVLSSSSYGKMKQIKHCHFMTFPFSKAILLFFITFSVGFSSLPVTASAALVPCGRNSGTEAEKAPCTVCHIVVGGKGIIDWGLGIMTVIAITVLFAMAVLYVISAGNDGLMGTAKGGIKAALIGFAIMLSAWLIVNIVLTVLVDTTDAEKPFKDLIKTGAFTFTCDAKSTITR